MYRYKTRKNMSLKHLMVALLAITLFSCSKDSDDEGDPEETTVNFTNKLDLTLNNAIVGSWKGGEKAKVIKKIGTLAPGATTGEIRITDPTVQRVYIYYDQGDKTYMTSLGYGVSQGTFNNWNIDLNAIYDEIEKSDQYYPE